MQTYTAVQAVKGNTVIRPNGISSAGNSKFLTQSESNILSYTAVREFSGNSATRLNGINCLRSTSGRQFKVLDIRFVTLYILVKN